MWALLRSFLKNQISLILCILVGGLTLVGCQARTHLSPHYARSYRYVFNAQIQNTRTLVNPISAKDAKTILEKRASRQTGSSRRQGSGRAFSRRSSSAEIESLGL